MKQATSLDRSSENLRRWIPWVVLLLTVVVFLPALRGEFVKLDDDYNYVDNPNFRGLGIPQLRWMFFWFQLGGVYQPLSWLTNSIDYLIWGLNPLGYHLGNILLHGLSALVFYFIALRLLDLALPAPKNESRWGLPLSAAFAALFYSIHPLRVEVVAWASNRSYVLPAVFYLLSIWAYLKAKAPEGNETSPNLWLFLSWLMFALSLMSKAIGMALPIILICIDMYPLRRWGEERGWFSRDTAVVLVEKIPYFLLSMGAGAIAAQGRRTFGEIVPLSRFGIGQRLGEAFFGSIFYLEKTLVPLRLAPLYSLPAHLNPFDDYCLARTILFFAISGIVWWNRKRWPAALPLWVAYLAAVAPFLGLSQYGRMLQIASDKWCYLASYGWAALAGGGLLLAWRARDSGKISSSLFRKIGGASIALLLLFGGLSWAQTLVWHDSEGLFRYILEVEPDCYFCHGNLANLYNERRDFARGIEEGLASLRIKPDYYLAHIGLSVSYSSVGRLDDAIQECAIALQQDPGNPDAAEGHYNLGYFYSLKGDLDGAIRETTIATQLKPYLLNAQFNLAYFLQEKGLLEDAAARYRLVLQANPQQDNAHFNLGLVYKAQGKMAEAVQECREAYRLNPAHDAAICPRE